MSFPYGAPDPGWYPDPRIPGVERHWDGLAWTEHTRPAAAPPGTLPWPGGPMAPATPDHGPSSALHWLLPVGRSWQSVVAPYAALVALLAFFVPPLALLLAAVAIVLGVWALVRATQGGHGTGRAIVALVIAVAAVLAALGFAFSTP